MSLLFSERTKQAMRYLECEGVVPPDGQEFVAVMGTIFQLAFDRLYDEFDFPETWKKDPESYKILVMFVIRLLMACAPGDKIKFIEALQKELMQSRSAPAPRTNRERERERRLEVRLKQVFHESRAHDPKRYGRVREHTQSELNEFLDKSARRAAKAFAQWRSGVPLEQIDA